MVSKLTEDINSHSAVTKENLDAVMALRPIDDDLMRVMFKDNIPLTKLVLETFLNIKNLEITDITTQFDLKRLVGSRSLCLDVLATDDDGQKYDIEIQRNDKGADPKRARYHSAALDVEFLDAGMDFTQLRNTYVMFITETDVLEENQPIYMVERIVMTSNKKFNDGEHIVYVSGAYKGDDNVGKLIHDFLCVNSEDMYFDEMRETMKKRKESEEGKVAMCQIIEDRVNKEVADRIDKAVADKLNKAKHDDAISFALALLKDGTLTVEKISMYSKLPLDEVEALSKSPIESSN